MLILITRAERKAAEEAASAAVLAAAQVAQAQDSKAEASTTALGASETPASVVANDTHLRSAAKSTSLVTAFASKKRGTKRRRSLSPVPSSLLFGQLVAQYPESDVRFTPLLAKPHTTPSDAATPQTSRAETYLFAAPLLHRISLPPHTTTSILPPGTGAQVRAEGLKVPHSEGYELGGSKRQMWARKRAEKTGKGTEE
ncbi:hypothetical protein B0A54_03830 [Friedmanniomyces endolithicus]|uniref:Uncharacterized protein n=1 Tax=Friedmanniomyces endolithicus TaxID=329885 RepID=A0A4U0VD34_9PEZI|nr:hypothetical protein LTS09_003012 [Friedmanniomyces endolithicus]TKA46874.1 hypothetical protein B0A54_03830 [Friedmanniomyces endolithicus]